MKNMLRQSTTKTIRLGPFVDATDGVTPETGLAGTMTVYLSKNGGAFAARNSATAPVHDRDGYYSVELDATDTNTLGDLIIEVSAPATHAPVFKEMFVAFANLFDSLVANTDFLEVVATSHDWGISGATYTAYKKDGTTTQFTKTLTNTPGANPVTAAT